MFEGTRLSNMNIGQYVNSKKFYPVVINNIQSLLQDNYGEANDCTLTSITTVIHYFLSQEGTYDIYKNVEKIARKHGYFGSYGTPSLMIPCVYQKSLNKYSISKKVKTFYLKDIGYTFEQIKKEIANHNPILLNLWKDGRNYYKNHTVLIVGYLEINNYKLLVVYDNWSLGMSYIDYSLLSTTSSISIIK